MTGKLILRSLGIISTLILVRLLDPNDFGIVAIGMMVVGLFQVLATCGAGRYLILQDNPSDDLYNSAWTLDIIMKGVATVILLFSAPAISSFLENEELTNVLWILCCIQYIGAFRNIGLIKDQKALNFKTTNQILVIAKVMSFSVTVAVAIIFKNYYALIIGTLINICVEVVVSYKLCKFVPKLNFNISKDMFLFSRTLLLRNIVGYSRSQLDVLLVGKLFGVSSTGEYSIARQFSTMPLTEIVVPAMQPILSSISIVKHDSDLLYTSIYKAFFIVFLIVVPSIFGLFLVADLFTVVVLGDKWLNISKYLGIMGFLMLPFAIQPLLHIAYDVMGKPHLSVLTDLFGVGALVICFFIFVPESIIEFATLRIYVAIIATVLTFTLAKVFLRIKLRKLILCACIPLLASCSMYSAIECIYVYDFYSSLIKLFSIIFIGIFVYGLSFLLIVKVLFVFKGNLMISPIIPDFLFVRINRLIRLI